MNDLLNQRLRNINHDQSHAIESIIEGWNPPNGDFIFPIVEGPPGTGKTTVGVLASASYKEENPRNQIAYLCYTNYAADRALESFIEMGYSNNEVLRIIDSGKSFFYNNSPNRRYYLAYNYIEDLTPNQQRQLRNVPILISTIHSSSKIFGLKKKPLILIDEFSQVNPNLFFSTLYRVSTTSENPTGYSLLGDPNQLPVITSQTLLRPSIGTFISIQKPDYEPHRLNTQYRMHSHICESVNALRQALNTYRLETHDSAVNKDLTSIGYTWNNGLYNDFNEILRPNNPCVIINTDGLQGEEETGLEGSKYFESEARLAANLSTMLYNSYRRENGSNLISTILSPYKAQIGLIKSLLLPELREQCTTIYKSQGREYPSVIVSFARKNPNQWIGFLGDPQLRSQTYVACSRAQAKLIVLLSFSTFRGNRDFDFLIERSNHALIIDAEHNWVM